MGNRKVKTLLYWIGMALVMFLVTEGLLRLIMPSFKTTVIPIENSHDPLLGYTLTPNITVRFSQNIFVRTPTFLVKTNMEGFRDINHSINKLPGIIRIIVMGDSFVWGSGLEYEEIFTSKLQRSIKNVEIFNFGVPGYNIVQEIRIFIKKGLKYHPDIAIFLEGNPFSPPIPFNEKEIFGWLSKNIYVYRLFSLLKLHYKVSHTSPEIKRKMEEIAFSELKTLARLKKMYNFKAIFMAPSPHVEIQKLFNEAASLGFEVYFYGKDLPRQEGEYRISRWDAHPNSEWHSLMAEIIKKKLFELGWIDEKNPPP